MKLRGEKYKRINVRFLVAYFSTLISVQAIGIILILVLRRLDFLTVLVSVIFLGTVWPILLHVILYNLMIKGRRLSI